MLLQLAGWTAPVIMMTILLFGINIRTNVGIGGARVLSGGTIMLLALLFKAIWQYQFGPMEGALLNIAHLVVLAGSALVISGLVQLFDLFLLRFAPERDLLRKKKQLGVVLLLVTGSVTVLSVLFAVFRMAPAGALLNYALYNLDISIAACIYFSFALLGLPALHAALRRAAPLFIAAGCIMLLDAVFRTYYFEFGMNVAAYLRIRLGFGIVLAVIGAIGILLVRKGASRLSAVPAPAPVKDSILSYKLNVQKRFAIVLAISIIVIGATGFVIMEVIQSGRKNTEETYLNEQRKVAESVAANMEGINSALLTSLKELTLEPGVQNVDIKTLHDSFRSAFAVWKNVAYTISRTDERGILRYTYPEMPDVIGRDISFQPHVRRFLAEHDTLFTGVFQSVQGKYAFGMYVPVYARNPKGGGRHFAGGVGILLHMDAYAVRAFRNTSIFTPNPLAAVNSEGRVIVASRMPRSGQTAQDYLQEIFPSFSNRDSLDAAARRMAGISEPAFIRMVNSSADRDPDWLVAHPVRFSNKPWGVVILPVSSEQIFSLYTETVGKQMLLWGLFAVMLVLLMGTVVGIFYRWSRFLEEEVKKELRDVREAEGRYAKLVNEAVVGIFQTTAEGKLMRANPSMASMLAYPSTEALIEADVFRRPADASSAALPWDAISAGSGIDTQVKIHRADGSMMDALVHCKAVVRAADGAVDRYEGFIEDVTERRRLEQQLIQAQKLEGIGTLAGGIAHDFNNLLAMILGSAELLRIHAAAYPQLKKYVDRIVEASERGASISRQLLIFSRPDQAELKPVVPADIITELEDMLHHFLPKSVSVETRIECKNGIILGDAGHLHQALLNLSLNANDAMPKGGSIVIREFSADFETVQRKFPSALRTPYIAVSIADTGYGMDESMKAKIFDPFFSTKERGKGTGLGLAIVHGIVKSHNGFIDVESVPNKGTVFTLYFPAVGSNGSAKERDASSAPILRGGRILIVDDEEFIRDLLGEHLSGQGFSVLMAPDGKAALRLYEENRASIDLVITDLGMPEMGGEELFVRLRALNPAVKVMVSSGYLEKTTKDHLLALGICEVLTKPYRLENIQTAIRSHLEIRA
ncbi:MAG: response regulator [Acidobacteriota bacterium]